VNTVINPRFHKMLGSYTELCFTNLSKEPLLPTNFFFREIRINKLHTRNPSVSVECLQFTTETRVNIASVYPPRHIVRPSFSHPEIEDTRLKSWLGSSCVHITKPRGHGNSPGGVVACVRWRVGYRRAEQVVSP
jgi:hypothetical protein